MSDEAERAVLLLVGSDPGVRQSLCRMLAAGGPVVPLAPAALRERARWLDAGGAVVFLDGRRGDAELEALQPLRDLPAGRALVLIADAVPDPLLERAIERLAPVQILVHPAPQPALQHAVQRALPSAESREGARSSQRPAPALLGVSGAIRDILDSVKQVARSRVRVLILGETGTGKELVARAIHAQSDRAGGPFVAINCGALPDSLLESELFGHERGAFTGAEQRHAGLFEEASGGTLFLDEVGDMPASVQVKLLRALETGEVRAVGASRARAVDVRVVSATHRDLESCDFRQDLFYRLNTVTLFVPPLRRRRVDIPFLAQHFAEEFGAENARRIVLDEDFIEALTRHDFPGNVRELKNAVERAIALTQPGQPVGVATLPEPISAGAARTAPPLVGTLRERIERLERDSIREALERLDGNRTHTARELGLSRHGLRQKMQRLGVD